jgi:hypothetical protein
MRVVHNIKVSKRVCEEAFGFRITLVSVKAVVVKLKSYSFSLVLHILYLATCIVQWITECQAHSICQWGNHAVVCTMVLPRRNVLFAHKPLAGNKILAKVHNLQFSCSDKCVFSPSLDQLTAEKVDDFVHM